MNPDQPEIVPASFPIASGRQRNGKVARLPKTTRDRINNMLLDGLPYASVLEKVGEEAREVTEANLGNWKAGGYQDWLREQQRVQDVRFRQEFAFDLVCDKDGNQLHQTTLQLAATNLVELLVDLDPAALRDTLQKDPDKYTRLLNAIARLSDGELRHQRHQADEAEREVKRAKDKRPVEKRGITDESLKQAEDKLGLM